MIPQAKQDLADLMSFIELMKIDYERGYFADWQHFIKPIRKWYTTERLQAIDDVVVGWEKMSSYADQQTLIHLTAALIGLQLLPEYQALEPEDQNLALWIILFHDVAKEADNDKHDLTHGFRSAAVCGQGLIRHGFLYVSDRTALREWVTLTQTAIIHDESLADMIQDNSKISAIMAGIDTLFGGRDTPVGLIICGVLFHMSLNVNDDYPASAPLTDGQICANISPRLLPLLKVMMLTDNMAWSLFDPETSADYCNQTRREFARIEALLAP